jgi:hypothetical protein
MTLIEAVLSFAAILVVAWVINYKLPGLTPFWKLVGSIVCLILLLIWLAAFLHIGTGILNTRV